jgi:3-deoxy-manno-octulosonate cytidylyltransferase (CMP-KDO synthetase)
MSTLLSQTDAITPTGAVLAVIPARYGSTRFPGKPLAAILGKPMIQHVWERVSQTSGIARAIIATDDTRICDVAEQFGAEVCMTSPDHPSGTDRLWEVVQQFPEADFPWLLNVQGDEPFIEPAHLQAALAGRASHPKADILTLVTPLVDATSWHDPNLVKAVLSGRSQALYFSRAAVPYHRDCPERPENAFRHLGLYLYRRSALETFVALPVSPLEALEKLEQLRALEAGLSIFAVVVDKAPLGVDTPHDLLRLEESARSGFP